MFREAASLSPLYSALHAAHGYEKIASGRNMYPYSDRPWATDMRPAKESEKTLTGFPKIEDKMQLSAIINNTLFINGTIAGHSEVLRGLQVDPKILISPRTIKEYSLAEGGIAEVSTEMGELRLKISLDKSLPDNVLLISNANIDSTIYNLISYNLESVAKTPYLKAATITLKMGG